MRLLEQYDAVEGQMGGEMHKMNMQPRWKLNCMTDLLGQYDFCIISVL